MLPLFSGSDKKMLLQLSGSHKHMLLQYSESDKRICYSSLVNRVNVTPASYSLSAAINNKAGLKLSSAFQINISFRITKTLSSGFDLD